MNKIERQLHLNLIDIKDYIYMRRNGIAGTLSKFKSVRSLNLDIGKTFWSTCQEIEGESMLAEPKLDTLEIFSKKYLEKSE
jgi:hypothetical protein